MKRLQRASIMTAAIIATGMAFIDTTALNVALDSIRHDLRASNLQLLWTLNAYAVALASLLLSAGSFSDRLGHRRVFAAGVIVFAVSSLACGLAPSIEWLIRFRVLQGIGAALMIPGSLILICDTWSPEARGKAVGMWTGCSVLMMTVGPIIGGTLADYGLWRMIFFLNIPLSLVVLLCLGLSGQDDQPQKVANDRFDWAGMGFAATGLGLVSAACLQVSTETWQSVAWTMIFGIVMLIAFAWHERRTEKPMLPMELIRKPQVAAACLIIMLIYAVFHAMLVFIPLRLIQIDQLSALMAGVAQLPTLVCLILFSPFAGAMFDRLGPRITLSIGVVSGTVGFLLLALSAGNDSYWLRWFPGLTMLGIGLAFSITSLSTLLMNAVSVEQLGIASSLNSAASRVASVIGIAALCGIGFALLGNEFQKDTNFFSSTEIRSSEYRQAFENMFVTMSYVSAVITGSCLLIAGWFLRNANSDH